MYSIFIFLYSYNHNYFISRDIVAPQFSEFQRLVQFFFDNFNFRKLSSRYRCYQLHCKQFGLENYRLCSELKAPVWFSSCAEI